jgi:dUTP pyrophosphatase
VLYQIVRSGAKPPELSYEGATSYDIHACLISVTGRPNVLDIPPHFSRAVPTGLILAVDPFHSILLLARPGLASALPPVFIPNGPALVQNDFRGELKVLLYNGGRDVHRIQHGDAIAQAIILPRRIEALVETRELATDDLAELRT